MNKNKILKTNQKTPGIKFNGYRSIGGSHPPKNRIEPRAHISNIFAYSPNQNIAYIIPEYSVWYPATSSASASGKSNGGLFVSAKAEIKKITNIGNSGIMNHISFCAKTITLKFKDHTHNKTFIIIIPIDTS